MASLSQRRKRRLRATSGPTRRGSNDLVITSVIPGSATGGCIDLTALDDDQNNASIVDLTNSSVNDTPVVMVGSQSPPRRRRRRVNTRGADLRAASFYNSNSSDSEIEVLPELPFDLSVAEPFVPTPGTSKENTDNTPSTPANNVDTNTSILSTPGKSITCPVCLDSDKAIRNSKRQLMSTNCGHVFCSECIEASINSQKKCPNCRKKLTLKQIHPIFI